MIPNCLIPCPMHAELQPGGMEIAREWHCRAADPFGEFASRLAALGRRFSLPWQEGDGEGFVPELPASAKRLNNLVTVLRTGTLAAGEEFTVVNPRYGWVLAHRADDRVQHDVEDVGQSHDHQRNLRAGDTGFAFASRKRPHPR